MKVDNFINGYFDKIKTTLDKFDRKKIGQFIELLMLSYREQRSVFIFGNGGSAANASHFCGDFVKGVSYGLEKRFRVNCLSDNIPSLLAIANDISYDDIFIEQLKNFLKNGDLVIGVSGSGNSPNVVKALEYAKGKGAMTVAVCGFDGGKIIKICDLALHAKINNMEVVEDAHLALFHCVKNSIIQRIHDKGSALNPIS